MLLLRNSGETTVEVETCGDAQGELETLNLEFYENCWVVVVFTNAVDFTQLAADL